MPVGTPFTSENQPEGCGRPARSISLSTRIQRILEGDEKLPDIIDKTIRNAVGAGKKPIDAVAGLLQALQGDKGWAEWLSNNGYGKPKERVEHSGDPNAPIRMTIKWQD
ncbi:hypothetical protein ACVDG5_006910 [Mesorhizobium sp. ORM6]